MDFEKEKRRQTIKVILAESLMVLSVIALVVTLVFIVSGYWINADFEVERSGLLQISSQPTGAMITVDGETWFQRTNTSKMVASAEHKVLITKDGYDTWEKDIVVSDGLLYRLHYPRLFLQERVKEKVMSLEGLGQVRVSPKHDVLLIYQSGNWNRIDLNMDVPAVKPMTSAEATALIEDWKKIVLEQENYDEDGNMLIKFYEDEYAVMLTKDLLTVIKKENNDVVFAEKLTFVPELIEPGREGDHILMSNGRSVATLDMEMMSIVSWSIDGEEYGWLDDNMIYTVDESGKLIVYDYDGLNRREIADGVMKEWPVTITKDKWLYYFSDDSLMREWLIPHQS